MTQLMTSNYSPHYIAEYTLTNLFNFLAIVSAIEFLLFQKAEDPDYEVSSVVKLSRVERLSCDFCSRPAENKDGKKFLLICKDCNAKGKSDRQGREVKKNFIVLNST